MLERPTPPYDPLVTFDRATLMELMRARGLSPTELARRAGLAHPTVLALLRERRGEGRGKATQRVRLSSARALATALDAEYDKARGTLTAPPADSGGAQRGAASGSGRIRLADAERLRELLGVERGADADALRALVDVDLWSGGRSIEDAPDGVQGRFGRALLDVARVVHKYGSDQTRTLLRTALVRIGRQITAKE